MSLVKVNWVDAATSTVTTDPEEVTGAKNFALQVALTGSPSSLSVVLEGSIDGAAWSTLVSNNDVGTVWSAGDRPVKSIRARVATLSGGSSPTVSVSVVAI